MRYRNQKDCRSGFYAASLSRLLQGREAKRRNFCRSLTPLCSLLLSTCSTLLFCLLNSDTVLFSWLFFYLLNTCYQGFSGTEICPQGLSCSCGVSSSFLSLCLLPLSVSVCSVLSHKPQVGFHRLG